MTFAECRQAFFYLLSLPREPYGRISVHQVCERSNLLATSIMHLVYRHFVLAILQLRMPESKAASEICLAPFKPRSSGRDTEHYMRRYMRVESPPSVTIKETSQVMPKHLIAQVSGPFNSRCLPRVYSVLRKALAKLLRADDDHRMLQNRSKPHGKRSGMSLLVGILIGPVVTTKILLEAVKVRFVLGSKTNSEHSLVRHATVSAYKAKPVSLRLCIDYIEEVMVAGIASKVFSGSARKASLPEGFLHTLGRYLELLREAYYRFTCLIPAAYFFDINGAPIMATTASGWSEGDATLLQPASNDWARCPVIPSQATYRGTATVRDTYLLDCVFRELPHFLSIPVKKCVANHNYYEREKQS